MPDPNTSLDIQTLLQGYRSRQFTATEICELLLRRLEDTPHERNIWITLLSRDQILSYARAIEARSPEELPLYGIPFAIKDNIDLAGIPTSAACPDYAYTPPRSATVIQRLIDAGAIPIGKTNLDQFATGLVGTRSPFGACQNSFDTAYISGGSSSGSAVAVALGLVSFSLGTDTAGSGRVPAAFNNLIGLKPTRGLISASGVVPACRSLDCVTVFALSAADAGAILDVAAETDSSDPYSRADSEPVLGRGFIPEQGFYFGVPAAQGLEFFGDGEAEGLFRSSVERLESLGGIRIEVDLGPFLQAARLLYDGPWVVERYLAIKDFFDTRPQALHPVTREIIGGAEGLSAGEVFASLYHLQHLRRISEEVWKRVDVIVTPTAGTIYRIEEVEADPVRLNSNLGYYTNFMNLLDLAAVAVPAGFRPDGLPLGVTLFAPAFADRELLGLGDRLQRASVDTAGATGLPLPGTDYVRSPDASWVQLAVCGAHMSGLPLNHQLTERGARLLCRTHTAAHYRLYALPGGPPARPGLVRVASGGVSVEVEVWAVPVARFGSFVANIPAPLGIGRLELEDGREVSGFICEGFAAEGAEDISQLGGWRRYLSRETGSR